MVWPMQIAIRSPSRSRDRRGNMCHRCTGGGPRPRAGLRRPLKTFIEWTIHNFRLPRCGSDRFRTVSRHRLCFAPAKRHHGHFPPLRLTRRHGRTTQSCVIKHTRRACLSTCLPGSSASRKTPFSTALRCLTAHDKAQDTRILQHAGSLQVTSSCSCNGTHLTDAAESRPFLALRYESRPSLPLLDRCDEGCAAQG